jgi:aminoglycoside phosphotransferase (APT) family kinase protein
MPSHGDFNSANIMITKDGNVNFIDFAECGYDHPFLDLGWLLFILGQTEKEMAKTLLALYTKQEPSKMEIDEVLFFEELSAFFLGTIWLTRQENNDIKKLEELFKTDLKRASDYVKEGLKRTEIAKMSKEELTNYALGFFKDFVAIRQMRKAE